MKPRDAGMIEKVTHAIVAAIKAMGGMVYKPIHGARLAPKEPDEVLGQRQLESWLDPGWCMTAPASSEGKVSRKGKLMLWWITGVLTLLGLVGLVTNYAMGGLIPIALMLVIVIVLVRLIRERRLS